MPSGTSYPPRPLLPYSIEHPHLLLNQNVYCQPCPGIFTFTTTIYTLLLNRVLAMASKQALQDWNWRDSSDSSLAGQTQIPTKYVKNAVWLTGGRYYN